MITVSSKVFLIPAPHHGAFPYCNCLYIKDDVHGLIDSSCGEEQAQNLIAESIDVLINSHFHGDHTGQNWMFDRSQIWAHYIDAPAIRSHDNWNQLFGFQHYGETKLGIEFAKRTVRIATPVNRELEDNELLDFGSTKLKVVHTPGHTRGHCVFFEENEEILFSADICLSKYGPWYGHYDSDIQDTIDSIKRCQALKPRLVISGHGGIFQGNIEKHFTDYLNIVMKKEEIIYNALKAPCTIQELLAMELFSSLPASTTSNTRMNRLIDYFEKVGIIKHLERLLSMKAIAQAGDVYYQA